MRKIFLPLSLSLLLAGCSVMKREDAPASMPHDPLSDSFSTYLSARHAAQQHDMAEAARFYAQSVKNDPENADLLPLAFFYSTTSGDFDAAARYAQRVVATTPDDRSARMALAVIAFKQKNYEEVRKQLTASGKGPLTVFVVSLFDAWAAAALGDNAGVASDIKTLQGLSGTEAVAAFHAALIAEFMNQDADALYAKALLLNPGSPRVVEGFGRYLERKGKTDDATRFYRGMANSTTLAPLGDAGLARLAKGQKPDPLVRSAEEGAAEGLLNIASTITDASDADISILYLRMVLHLRPDMALATILLGDRYEKLNKLDEAIAVYNKVDKSSPYYRLAAVQAARDEAQLDRNDNAITQLKALTQSNPKDSDSWLALGDAYRESAKFGDAVGAYNQAEGALTRPAKKDWPLFYARAMAHDKAGQWDKAEADVNTGLKLSPDQPELLNYLAYSWVDQGRRYQDALSMLEKARALRPYDGYIVDSVGWAYYRLGRYEDAAQTLEAAVLMVPGDATINDHLGDALWKAGRKMEARYQWDQALVFNPEASEKASLEQKLKSGLNS